MHSIERQLLNIPVLLFLLGLRRFSFFLLFSASSFFSSDVDDDLFVCYLCWMPKRILIIKQLFFFLLWKHTHTHAQRVAIVITETKTKICLCPSNRFLFILSLTHSGQATINTRRNTWNRMLMMLFITHLIQFSHEKDIYTKQKNRLCVILRLLHNSQIVVD